MEKGWEFYHEFHQTVKGFKEAFDRVCRMKLWTAMHEFGFPKKLVNLRCEVTVEKQYSETFEINNGVRQRDAIFHREGPNLQLAFADDVSLNKE